MWMKHTKRVCRIPEGSPRNHVLQSHDGVVEQWEKDKEGYNWKVYSKGKKRKQSGGDLRREGKGAKEEKGEH